MVHNEEGSSQEPHAAPTEEPSAEEPPENDEALQGPRDAPTEEPTAEESPGPSTTESHDPEISRPESVEDDGHLRHPNTPPKHAPQEPHDAPAEEQNVEEPPAKPPPSKKDQPSSDHAAKTSDPDPIPPEPPPVKITTKVYEKHKSSPGCHACLLGGPLARFNNHDPECRRRFAHLCA